jgi:hypothetical protein
VGQATFDTNDSLCYAGGELLAYRDASLTSLDHYDLTHLQRGLHETTPGAADGSLFVFLGKALFKYRFNPALVGKTVYLKFQGFNYVGGSEQAMADLVAYPYEIGSSGNWPPGGGPGGSGGTPYDFYGFYPDNPNASQVLFRGAVPRSVRLPEDLAGSYGLALTAPDAEAVFGITRNGTSIGSMTFAATEATATFTFPTQVTLAAGDVLAVVAPASADPAIDGISWTLAGIWFGTVLPYDFYGLWSGQPGPDAVLFRAAMPRTVTLPQDLAGSHGKAGTAATAQADFDLQQNGASIGTMSFAAAASVATFTFTTETSLAAGDILSVHAPATPDASLADIYWTLAGTCP